MSKKSFRRSDPAAAALATSGACAVCGNPGPYLLERSQQWVCADHLDSVIASYGRRVAALSPQAPVASPYTFRRWSPNDCEVQRHGALVASAIRRQGEWRLFAWPTREQVATAATLEDLQVLAPMALQSPFSPAA